MKKYIILAIIMAFVLVGMSTFFSQIYVSADPPIIKILSTNDISISSKKLTHVGQPTINDNGDVVFSASEDSNYGIFRSSKGLITKLVSSGDITPVGGTF